MASTPECPKREPCNNSCINPTFLSQSLNAEPITLNMLSGLLNAEPITLNMLSGLLNAEPNRSQHAEPNSQCWANRSQHANDGCLHMNWLLENFASAKIFRFNLLENNKSPWLNYILINWEAPFNARNPLHSCIWSLLACEVIVPIATRPSLAWHLVQWI